MSRGAQRRFNCPWEGSDPSLLLAFGSQLVLGVLSTFAEHAALSSRQWRTGRRGEQAGKHQHHASGRRESHTQVQPLGAFQISGGQALEASPGGSGQDISAQCSGWSQAAAGAAKNPLLSSSPGSPAPRLGLSSSS